MLLRILKITIYLVCFISQKVFQVFKSTFFLICNILSYSFEYTIVFTIFSHTFISGFIKSYQRAIHFYQIKKNHSPYQSIQFIFLIYFFNINPFLTLIFFEENKRRSYSKENVDILKNWFYANYDYPYASIQVKKDLAKKTNLNIQQVTYWLSNERKKLSIAKKSQIQID